MLKSKSIQRYRSFKGENGRKYTWTYKGSCAMRVCVDANCPTNLLIQVVVLNASHLQLYPADGEGASNRLPIAEYHPPHYVFNERNAYIQLQPEALEILDTLIGP